MLGGLVSRAIFVRLCAARRRGDAVATGVDGVGDGEGEDGAMKQFVSHSGALAAWQRGEVKTGEVLQIGSCPPHIIVVEEPGTARLAFASECHPSKKV